MPRFVNHAHAAAADFFEQFKVAELNRQFERRRGIMTGVVKVGTAAGQISLPLVAAFFIALYDWRLALLSLGIGAAAVLLFAALLMKSPSASGGTDDKTEAAGVRLRDVRRSRTFWMLCAIQFTFISSLTTIPLHIAVHGMDLGMSPALAKPKRNITSKTTRHDVLVSPLNTPPLAS